MAIQAAATLHAELHELEVQSTNGPLHLTNLEAMISSAKNISEKLQHLGLDTHEAEVLIQNLTAAAQQLKKHMQKHPPQSIPEVLNK